MYATFHFAPHVLNLQLLLPVDLGYRTEKYGLRVVNAGEKIPSPHAHTDTSTRALDVGPFRHSKASAGRSIRKASHS